MYKIDLTAFFPSIHRDTVYSFFKNDLLTRSEVAETLTALCTIDIEKIIEEMIKLKKEIEEEIANGNEYDLSPEEKAFFDALGADPEIKELMQDEVLVQIAKDLVELINENLTLDAFKREDARARIRSNIRRLLIKYNYPPVKREGAVDKVIKQAELKYSNN